MTVAPKIFRPSHVKPRAEQRRLYDDRRGSSAQRGYGAQWQRAREAHLIEQPLCVQCLREGRSEPATVVDHVIPHRGNMTLFWDRENWQSLCAPHHNSWKQSQEKSPRGRG